MLNETASNQKNEVAELDLVFISDKEVMTDSLLVAKAFGKRHDNVIRDIERVAADIADISTHLKFEVSGYRDATGRKLLKYNLCKDALMLLIMGYGGKKAMSIKIKYINAFNAMYKYITEQVSLQDRLFNALQKEDASFAKGSLGGKLMQERKMEKPINKAEIESILNRLQVELDFTFTGNKRVH